jgi:hypothetical protein
LIQQKANESLKKLKDAEKMRLNLSKQIIEKQKGKEQSQEQIHELEMSNDRFNNMKNMFAEKRKEYTNNQALNRIKRSEEIAKVNLVAQKELERQQDAFLEAISRATEKTQKTEQLRKQTLKEQAMKEEQEFQMLHKQRKDAEKQLELITKQHERAHNIRDTELWKEEGEQKVLQKKETLQKLKAHHIEQIVFFIDIA